ncbi:hypothetical protein BC826DRAFT_1173122 [Russula brevipes]|nr:hypothetical protein BC826DRAFT_1173122 [Russula brevipes]
MVRNATDRGPRRKATDASLVANFNTHLPVAVPDADYERVYPGVAAADSKSRQGDGMDQIQEGRCARDSLAVFLHFTMPRAAPIGHCERHKEAEMTRSDAAEMGQGLRLVYVQMKNWWAAGRCWRISYILQKTRSALLEQGQQLQRYSGASGDHTRDSRSTHRMYWMPSSTAPTHQRSQIPRISTIGQGISPSKGMLIPKETLCPANLWQCHHDPTFFGHGAADFNPERFLDENGKLIPGPVETQRWTQYVWLRKAFLHGEHAANELALYHYGHGALGFSAGTSS